MNSWCVEIVSLFNRISYNFNCHIIYCIFGGKKGLENVFFNAEKFYDFIEVENQCKIMKSKVLDYRLNDLKSSRHILFKF